jgi:hypothetical protein
MQSAWIVEGDDLYPPPFDDFNDLIAGDFKVSLSVSPGNNRNVWKHGIERIVHDLRGIREGIALGGGAARDMCCRHLRRSADGAAPVQKMFGELSRLLYRTG